MRTKIFFISVLFCIAVQATAQKKILVYHVNGDVNLVSGSNAAAAKRGDVLTKSNTLKVKPGANCMIIGDKGSSVQLGSGSYTFDEVQKRLANAAGTSVTQKFFSYVYEELSSGKGADKLSVTPVVFRGEELMKTPADNAIITADLFTLGWKKPVGKIPVHLTIWDNAGKKILDTVLRNSTAFQADINNRFIPGNVYKWKTEESDTHQPKEKYFYFLIADNKDRQQILKDEKLFQDKKYSPEVKAQLQQDIFLKWKQYYDKT